MNALSDIQFKVRRLPETETFLCADLTLIFAAEGELDVTFGADTFHMQEHDIVMPELGLSCTLAKHGSHSTAAPVYTAACFSSELADRVANGSDLFFLCNSAADSTHSYRDLRNIFYELMHGYIAPPGRAESMTDSLMLRLFDTLLENYLLDDAAPSARYTRQEDERSSKVRRYVLAHYQEQLNLSTLAEEMYVSTSTLSRSFHKSTGVYFADFVNTVRAHHAAQDIVCTDKPLTRIAYECGFSNSQAFNKAFKKQYGCTPTAYREQKRSAIAFEAPANPACEDDQLRESLSLRDEYVRSPSQRALPTSAESKIGFSMRDAGTHYERVWNRFVNAGSVRDVLSANVQRHILYLQEHLHIEGVRIWSIFSTHLHIVDSKRPHEYNFDLLDQALDFLVEHDLKVYVDMGPRPSTILLSGNDVVRWEYDYVPPASKGAWQQLVMRFIKHIVRRYRRHVVSQWIFEVSCDTVHADEHRYYEDEQYWFWDAYDYIYQLVKRELPGARVGGSSGIISLDWEFLVDGMAHCAEAATLPDFLSIMVYPYRPMRSTGGAVSKGLSLERDSELAQLQMAKELLAKTGHADMPVYISEFNNTVSGRNWFNDGCFRAAYFAKKISQIWNQVDLLVPMISSDWIDADSDFHGVVGGGLGLLTKDTIEKPVFHALQLLNLMGDHVVSRGDSWVVTQRGGRDFYILAFNYQWFSKRYFLEPESARFIEDESAYFEGNAPSRMVVAIDGARAQEYFVKTRAIRPSEGCILKQWADFGYETSLTGNDIRYLRTSCYPRLQLRKMAPEAGVLSLELEPELHEVLLVHIYEA